MEVTTHPAIFEQESDKALENNALDDEWPIHINDEFVNAV
jgi:hypothetical protein